MKRVFTQQQEAFLRLPQITDVDVDGSGQLFLSAWDGAGYKGNDSKGFIVRATPKDWKYEAFPNLKTLSNGELVNLLKSESATARLHAQQALISRADKSNNSTILAIAKDAKNTLEVRVAAIFTYAQLAKEYGVTSLAALTGR